MVDISGVDPQLSFDPSRGIRPEGLPETPRNRPAGQDDRPDDLSTESVATQNQTGISETPAPSSPPAPNPATDRIEISPEATALGASGGPELDASEITLEAPETPETLEATDVAAPTSDGSAFSDSGLDTDLDTDLLSSDTQPFAAPQTGPSDGTESNPLSAPAIDQSSLDGSTSNTLEIQDGPSDSAAALQFGLTGEGTPTTNQETSSELERTGNDNQSQTEANRTLGQVVDVFA